MTENGERQMAVDTATREQMDKHERALASLNAEIMRKKEELLFLRERWR